MDKSLSCMYCDREFDLFGFKPMCLGCGHSICYACCLESKQSVTMVKCPIDNRDHEFRDDLNIVNKLTTKDKCIFHRLEMSKYCDMHKLYYCEMCKEHENHKTNLEITQDEITRSIETAVLKERQDNTTSEYLNQMIEEAKQVIRTTKKIREEIKSKIDRIYKLNIEKFKLLIEKLRLLQKDLNISHENDKSNSNILSLSLKNCKLQNRIYNISILLDFRCSSINDDRNKDRNDINSEYNTYRMLYQDALILNSISSSDIILSSITQIRLRRKVAISPISQAFNLNGFMFIRPKSSERAFINFVSLEEVCYGKHKLIHSNHRPMEISYQDNSSIFEYLLSDFPLLKPSNTYYLTYEYMGPSPKCRCIIGDNDNKLYSCKPINIISSKELNGIDENLLCFIVRKS